MKPAILKHRKSSSPSDMTMKKKPQQPRSVNQNLLGCRIRTPTKKELAAAAAISSQNDSPFNVSRRRVSLKPRKERQEDLLSEIPSLLPPETSPEKKTIFLDLDQTLVYSTAGRPPETYDFAVTAAINGKDVTKYVQKRPGVDEFLAEVCRDFEVVAFTAAGEQYASPVLDQLDPTGVIFSHRLYRNSCVITDDGLLKDLSDTGRCLGRVLIVDDSPKSYAWQPENAIPVRPYLGGRSDRELLGLIQFFKACAGVVDTRDAAAAYRSGRHV